MRQAIRDHNYVTFDDATRIAAFDCIAPDLLWSDGLWPNRFSSGDQCRGTFEHVKDVCIPRVDLSQAGSFSTAGVDLEAVGLKQWHAFRKCCIHLRMVNLENRLDSRYSGKGKERKPEKGQLPFDIDVHRVGRWVLSGCNGEREFPASCCDARNPQAGFNGWGVGLGGQKGLRRGPPLPRRTKSAL